MKNSFAKSRTNLTVKLLLSLAFLAIFNVPAFAQSGATVSGKVTGDNEPQSGVVVTLASRGETRFTTTSDENGEFRFENVPSGEYILNADVTDVSKTLLSARVRLNLTNGQTTTNDLELQPQARALGEVVVTASGTNQTVDQTSKAISIVTERELEERGETTIAEALDTVPGIRFQQFGGFGRLATIKTRGLRNQDTAILIDGQRFRDPSAITGDASPFLSDLVLTNLERVEVLRGSGSSLYGTNAIGGVINIITEEGGGEPRGDVELEAGGLGFFRGQAKFAGGANQDRIKYGVGVSHNNFGKGVDGEDDARNTSGQGLIAFDLGKSAVLNGRIYAGNTFVRLNSNPDTVFNVPATGIIEARPLSDSELKRYENGARINQLNQGDATFIPDANDPDARQSSKFFAGALNFEQQLNEKFGYALSYQNITTGRRNENGPGGVSFQPFGGNSRGEFDGNINTIRARTDFSIGKYNFVTAGYEFEREKYDNDSFAPNPANNNSTDATQRSNTFFVQDQIQAFDQRLQLSGAFRTQVFNLGTPRFSSLTSPYQNANLENPPTAYTGDGSIAYFFRASGTKLRAHVGNGYRVPSLFERYGSSFSGFSQTFIPLGAPDLEPERSIAFDTGIDQNLANNRVRLSSTFFYTRLTDTIGFLNRVSNVGNTPRIFGGYANTKGGIARGAEFSADLKPFSSLDIFTSYTFTNSDQRDPQVAGSGVIATLTIPAHQFSAVITQRFGRRFFVNFDFVATNSYLAPIFSNTTFATRIYRFDGLRKADLNASYEIPTQSEKFRVRIFGQIEDLLNQDYYENGFRTQNITGRAGLAFNF